MGNKMNIKRAVQLLARGSDEIYCKICVVDAVDEQARTVDCNPLDESAPLAGVNLQANQGEEVGVLLVPKVGSYVVVGFLSSDVAVVLLTMELDRAEIVLGERSVVIDSEKVVVNGGDNGGVINIQELTQKLNDLTSAVNALVNSYNTHTHSVETKGSAAAQSGTAFPTAATAQAASSFDRDDYEDSNFTH